MPFKPSRRASDHPAGSAFFGAVGRKMDHGLPNPSEWKMIVEVVEGRLFNIQSRLGPFFCSELIADSYVKIGLLPADRAVNAYMPKDFTSTGNLLPLKGQLKPEIRIEL